ncbi:MAG: hypothetical protein Q4G54_09035 [Pelistega sp.]|nr:hypothetical protein [Pelistega sp.]
MRIPFVRTSVICLGLLLSIAGPAQAKKGDAGKVTYVGGGRYLCTGNSVDCTRIKENNRRITRETIERGKSRHKR